MFCKNCGIELPDGAFFCNECGTQQPMEDIAGNGTVANDSTMESINTYQGMDNSSSTKKNFKEWFEICVLVILAVIAVGTISLLIMQYKGKNTELRINSSNRMLVIFFDDEELSDMVQIDNAIEKGGAIKVDLRNDLSNVDIELKTRISEYAAYDSANMYFPYGALLNYVESEGWELVQADSSSCYFTKSMYVENYKKTIETHK